jgi:hypothetical protein
VVGTASRGPILEAGLGLLELLLAAPLTLLPATGQAELHHAVTQQTTLATNESKLNRTNDIFTKAKKTGFAIRSYTSE